MYERIEVLDQGFVALVGHVGNDRSIVDAARVSYSKDQTGRQALVDEKDEKLIGYLMKNKHTTPFESVVLNFEVKAPIFIFRQWHRHRTWSYNEISARYTELPSEWYIPKPAQIGIQSTTNKQARDLVVNIDGELLVARIMQIDKYNQTCQKAFEHYSELIQQGWPRELARMVLPVSTYSRMLATVNLHNLFHFLRLRLHMHAQWEIRQYAIALTNLILPVVPVAAKAFLTELLMKQESDLVGVNITIS